MKDPRHVAVAIIHSTVTGRVLMITSRAHPDFWILPKGGIEKGETSGQAAVREAWEEAGTPKDLVAPIDGDRLMMLSLGPGKKADHGSVWHVHAISTDESAVDKVTDWPESHERKREWVTLDECLNRIRAWRMDQNASVSLEGDAVVNDARGVWKKDVKGQAMEMAMIAFADYRKLHIR